MKGSKVHLVDAGKDNKFDLVQSVPNIGISSASANVAAVAGQSAGAPMVAVQVHVGCNIEGSDISVDGEFVGNTPSNLQLPVGKHKILVSKDGFTSWERQLTVSSSEINLIAEIHPNTSK